MHLANWQLEVHNLVHNTNEQFKGQNKHQSTNLQWHVAMTMAVTIDQNLSIIYLHQKHVLKIFEMWYFISSFYLRKQICFNHIQNNGRFISLRILTVNKLEIT